MTDTPSPTGADVPVTVEQARKLADALDGFPTTYAAALRSLASQVEALTAAKRDSEEEVPANATFHGNSVVHWYNKAKACGDMVHGINPILGAAADGEKTCDAARRVVAERDALRERIEALGRMIRNSASHLDPECPDMGAYVDGHCSLIEVAERVVAERDALRAQVEAQLHELTDISEALGTNEGHSSAEHIADLRAKLAKAERISEVRRAALERLDGLYAEQQEPQEDGSVPRPTWLRNALAVQPPAEPGKAERASFTAADLIAECDAHWKVLPRSGAMDSWEGMMVRQFYDACKAETAQPPAPTKGYTTGGTIMRACSCCGGKGHPIATDAGVGRPVCGKVRS